MEIGDLLRCLVRHERVARASIHLTPSENVLSPLARLPFVLDMYSRYFLDDLRLFGSWSFRAGRELGIIEQTILLPVLRELARCPHVNVRPISGLNCMTIAMAALCPPGGRVLTVPLAAGGHASTSFVGARVGLTIDTLPTCGPYDLDVERLACDLKEKRPDLVYVDQSSQLFPIDPQPIRALVDRYSPTTRIHYDSSHVNGLILAGAMFNPLERGADSFGGSTHKTLPGPHKGFLATNDPVIAADFQRVSDHFVSHHHMADVAALAVTAIELRDCDGQTYGRRIIDNAQAFARRLHRQGLDVAAAERGFTACHQVWVVPEPARDLHDIADRLLACGIVVNNFPQLPGIARPAFRLSLAEVTRLGATVEIAEELADAFSDVVLDRCSATEVARRVSALRVHLSTPRYCFDLDDLPHMNSGADLIALLSGTTDGASEWLRVAAFTGTQS